MTGRTFITLITMSAAGSSWLYAASQNPTFRTDVDMVMVNFTITDAKGNYLHGLKPSDIRLLEDGVEQKIDTFHEYSSESSSEPGTTPVKVSVTPSPSNVFILFDTSNCMYDGFAYAEDSISEFVRRMQPGDPVALYSFARNLFRAAPLTTDRSLTIHRLRDSTAGDDTAVFSAMLMTLRDAEKVKGRKAIVVFSNGPDNASVIAPDDVRRVAEDDGVPIFVISTKVTNKNADFVFRALTTATGGKYYEAPQRSLQEQAFEDIRQDLGNSYMLTYYPEANPNNGFRKIRIELPKNTERAYRIRTRSGYEPRMVETNLPVAE